MVMKVSEKVATTLLNTAGTFSKVGFTRFISTASGFSSYHHRMLMLSSMMYTYIQ